MITEVNRLASDQQALSTTAGTSYSEAILDNVRQSPVYDGTLHFLVQVTTAVGHTSIQAVIQTSADNSAWSDLADSGAVAAASVPANGVLLDVKVEESLKVKRYLRVKYVTVGDNAGDATKVTAGEFTESSPKYRRVFTPGSGFEG